MRLPRRLCYLAALVLALGGALTLVTIHGRHSSSSRSVRTRRKLPDGELTQQLTRGRAPGAAAYSTVRCAADIFSYS